MLEENEVIELEKHRDKLRELYRELQLVGSKLATLTDSEFGWEDYDFDPEHLSDAIADYSAEVDDAITQMNEAIEEYDANQ